MRNSTDRFIDKVQAYLKESFSKRAEAMGIKDIVIWDRGFNAVIDSMTSYPACLTFIDSKTLEDITVTKYSLVIAIGVSADDDESLDEAGNAWCDILEDTIRSDWSLGKACLDTTMQIDIRLGVGKGVYVIYTQLDCSVDIGGFVYDPETGIGEVEVSTLQLEELPSTEGDSSDCVSTLCGDAGEGDTGEQEQAALAELKE